MKFISDFSTLTFMPLLYHRCSNKKSVWCKDGRTYALFVRVVLHQVPALSSCLFNLRMNVMVERKKNAPWSMFLMDVIWFVTESLEDLQRKMEVWGKTLKVIGLKIRRASEI